MKKTRKLITLIVVFSMLAAPASISAAETNREFEENTTQYLEFVSKEGELELYASPGLDACNLGVGIASNGVSVTYITRATQTADEIGVKNLVLQEKTTFGWKDISIGERCGYDRDYYAGSLVYTGAVKGKTYRVRATHYAVFNGVEKTADSISPELVYN